MATTDTAIATIIAQVPLEYKADRTISYHGVPVARCYTNRDEALYGPLFAAAPDLLANLQAIADYPLPFVEDERLRAEMIEQFLHFARQTARTAIAKATGQ